MTRRLVQTVLSAMALTLAGAALSFLTPESAMAARPDMGAVVVSNLLVAGVLLLVAVHATDRGLPLALTLFALWGSIQANYLLEALLFGIGVPRSDVPRLFAHALAMSAAAGLVVSAFVREPRAEAASTAPSALPAARLAGRLLGCGVVYLVLYVVAGFVIAWPTVREFYQARPMPAPGPVFALQIVRGAAFGLTMLLLIRRTRMDRLAQAMAGGLVMSVLGGAAPLLTPNAYMPDIVRLAHLAEVVVSNFVFGFMSAWLLSAPVTPDAAGTRLGAGSLPHTP